MARFFGSRSEGKSLEDKLLKLGLEADAVKYIVKRGEQFLNDPDILAEKLGIDSTKAKKALTEIKAYKEKQLSSEVKKFETLVKNNPTISLKKLALLNDIDDDVVAAYTESLNTKKLTESQRLIIKEKYNAHSIAEIAEELKTSLMKIREYVERNYITFNGTEGEKALAIIRKNFEEQPIMILREMIVNKNVKLQETICWDLKETNPKEFGEVKRYFENFQESQNFFEIDDTLSNEAKKCIRASTLEDIDELSIKLNRFRIVIRDYLLQYSPDEELMQDYAQEKMKQIQDIYEKFRAGNKQISRITYRIIISDSFQNLIHNVKTSEEKSPNKIFEKLLPIAFYYLKCSLPLKKFSQIIADQTKISLTTLDIFHLIFQMSDPVVRGLCIEHYSFSNPVPFYYPILNYHFFYLKQKFQKQRKTCQFEICKELWFSIQQFNGLVSFGLGWASWNPIGKSHLLDLMFETDFVNGSPQTSPFHLNSIDIQMTRNLFGKKDGKGNESTQWAYIDCHACSDTNVIRDICQNVDIALVHVSYSDYNQNTDHFKKELQTIAATTKHVYVFVRDCPECHRDILEVENSEKTKFLFIPNLTKYDMQIVLTPLKKFGYTILHSTAKSPRLVDSNFLEKLIRQYCSGNDVFKGKILIENIKNTISSHVQDSSGNKLSFLSYYPHFVEYMFCFYKASNEVEQKKIAELNSKCVTLQNILMHTNMSIIVEHFNNILNQENSTLLLWKLSQELSILSKELKFRGNGYTLEIVWREAVLSYKNYGDKRDKSTKSFLGNFSQSFSNHVERGEPFELIDGDNLRFFNQEINGLLSKLYEKQNKGKIAIEKKKRPPIVISILGPQSSGKSTLLNYCFGCKFLTSAGRCTKGVYASLSKLSRPINHSDHFLILDTEGLDAIEKAKTVQDTSCINFDRTMVLFCLAVSQAIIINVKGDIGEEMRNLLQICAYSLNKLKVSKVAAPKIFFVLNQQADPDPEKHLSSINTLLNKLNKESDLMETEGTKISDLIQVSERNLFVLPSAFNSETVNTQMCKLFDSDLFKLSPTESFANKCADLRMSIIHQLENTHDTKTLFNSMSEWIGMFGVIWDTIIKYQDIVKYRNTEELKCSILLRKIVDDLMINIIHQNKEIYQAIAEKSILLINDIQKWSPPNVILEDVKKELDEVFDKDKSKTLTDFIEKCQADPLLKKMEYMRDDSKKNMNRLIYREKKIYEDKLKIRIRDRLTAIRHKESLLKLEQEIEANADTYFELPIDKQESLFEDVWIKCFENKYEKESAEYDEKFENLYSVFMIESKTMEKNQTIYARFRQSEFIMDNVIRELEKDMLEFCETNKGTEQFIYPWTESRTPLKEMTPYLGNKKCQYLARNSLFSMKDDNYRSEVGKYNLKFKEWVPSKCYSLVRYCSGYYSHPDITWNTEKREQILLLASKLKDPDDFERSTWEKLINDIKLNVQEFTNKDPNIPHSTVKEIVNFLSHIFKVVNYEISYIEAKLTNAAERTISTYAFAFAFKSLLETNMAKQKENDLMKEKNKEITLKYFLQKVEYQKLARGNWDRKAMRKGEKNIAKKLTGDFLAGVGREIKATCKQNIEEEYFVNEKDQLSHKSILLLANKITTQKLHSKPVDETNFIVQFICNRTQCLRSLFQEEWKKVVVKLHDRICGNLEESFNQKITIVNNVLEEFLRQLKTMCTKKQRLEEIGTDSDSNFEVVDQPATEESATNINSTRLIPLKAMVLFLKMYLDPRVSPEYFKQFFNNDFEIDDVKVRKHPHTYVLFEKPNNPEHILDKEIFKILSDTNMFVDIQKIFNIEVYLREFLAALNSYQFQLHEGEYENLLEMTKENFEANIINCPGKCPSCGKFCEKELHPNGGKCQILTGHQMCSMGGNVWNTDEDRTAVLLMCEDYKDDSPVLILGQNMTWGEFKEKFCNEWDWDLPNDPKYVALQKKNYETMKIIWNTFGKEILTYYGNRGTQITFIPYTSPKEIYESLFSPVYYVCFVVDGTDFMGVALKHAKRWVSDVMKDSDADTSNFKVIVYHGHAVEDQKCIEMFPNNSEFTTDEQSIEKFLEPIENYGEKEDLLAMLDGLATATTKCGWKSGFGIKNVIVHFYVEPTKENFNIFKAKGTCDQGCHFDWKRDIKNKMKQLNIAYKRKRLISSLHPDYCTGGTPVDDQTTSDVTLTSAKESKHDGHVFIDLKNDF